MLKNKNNKWNGVLHAVAVSILSVSLFCLVGCSGGVNIEEADRVLTSLDLSWPAGFDNTCLSSEPVIVTIRALDQNGELFDWTGTVTIEPTNANVDVSPSSLNLANGIIERSISFINNTSEDQETGIRLSAAGVVSDAVITLLVYTAQAVQPSGFSLEWPAGFDCDCRSNEPLIVEMKALDADGSMLDWSGSVDILLTNPNVTVSPSTVNLLNGTVQVSVAFSNSTGQDFETGIKLSHEEIVSELIDIITVHEAVPPPDVAYFTTHPWDGEVRLTWTNPPEADFTGVRVMRKESGAPANAGDGDLVYEGGDEEYTDTGLINGTDYFYTAFSYDDIPNYSGGVTDFGTPTDSSVGSLTFLPADHQIELFWNAREGADSYNVYYTDDGTDPGIDNGNQVTGITSTSYTFEDLLNFHEYRFMVTALREGMESGESNVLRSAPPGTVIKAGYRHTVALKDDGTVWAWGLNDNGQLGDNTGVPGEDRDTPIQVVGAEGTGNLTGITDVAVGRYHSVALKSNDTVWAWGDNSSGQLGDSTGTPGISSNMPVQVVGEDGDGTLTGVVAVEAGWYHSVVLKTDGTVWAWGNNDSGQLGNGNTGTNEDTPVQVVGAGGEGFLSGIVAISAEYKNTMALSHDGTVWAWGDNDKGQLGDGTGTPGISSNTPVQVVGEGGDGILSGVAAVKAGGYHALALKTDGTVWAWGKNDSGQLGDNTGTPGTDSDTPVQVKGEGGAGSLSGVSAVAAQGNYSVALKEDGTVWAWGDNAFGQLGNGFTGPDSDTPVQVVVEGGEGVLDGIVAITAGAAYASVLKSDGTVWAWGDNDFGQLGNGDAGTDNNTPVSVSVPGGDVSLTGVAAIATGVHHSLAVKADGSVWTWGQNSSGQLGNNDSGTDRDTPVQVLGVEGVDVLSDIGSVAGGGTHSAAVKSDGTAMYTWGGNLYGQLGNGNTGTDSPLPVQVVGEGGSGTLGGVGTVAAGSYHTLALKTDGTILWAWGLNDEGQLGDNTCIPGTNSNIPVKVADKAGTGDLSGVGGLAAGTRHSAALKSDGTAVWPWGDNASGQLGDGNMGTGSDIPVVVSSLSGVDMIAALGDFTLAAMNDGSVYAWGENGAGQLGDGNSGTDSDTPVQVLGPEGTGTLSGVGSVGAGVYHSAALREDGTVWAWGDNGDGQLGDGNVPEDSGTPVQVRGAGGAGYLTDVAEVAVGRKHTMVLKEDGTVWAWGDNSYGQLGDGNMGTGSDTPVPAGLLFIGWCDNAE